MRHLLCVARAALLGAISLHFEASSVTAQSACQITCSQSGLMSLNCQVHMYPNAVCFQKYAPPVIGQSGTVRQQRPACGRLVTASELGWEYRAGGEPCVDQFSFVLSTSDGNQMTATYDISVHPPGDPFPPP
jgi:hypothetical protein